jgi:hypothetical protein
MEAFVSVLNKGSVSVDVWITGKDRRSRIYRKAVGRGVEAADDKEAEDTDDALLVVPRRLEALRTFQ